MAVREEGMAEIVFSDVGEERLVTVKKFDTAVDFPALAETNPTERMWIEYGVGGPVGEDEYIKLYLTTAATDNVVYSDSKISIPISRYNITLKTISSAVLTAADFDVLKDAGATGVTCTASVRTYLGKYKVGAKQVVKLGNFASKDSLDKANARILIVPYDDT